MITENLSTLKIHKLTQAQYDRELAAGRIDENALYLTPDEEIDLSGYALASDVEELQTKVGDDSVSTQINNATSKYLPLAGGTVSGELTLDGNMILKSASYGASLPAAGNAGRVFMTPSQNLFAPSGYGLNNDFKTTADPAVIDTYQTNGWYRYVNSAAQTLVPGFFIYYALIRVDSFSENSTVTQTLFPTASTYLGSQLTRYLKPDKTWSQWEWINPPMELGKEYRTTERYLNKPVYVKVIDFGAMPNNTYKSITHGLTKTAVVFISATDTNGKYCFPSKSNSESVDLYIDALNIVMTVTGDWSANNVYVTVKYTKD